MVAISTDMAPLTSALASALGALYAAPLDGPLEAPLDAAGEVGLVGVVAAAVLALLAITLRGVRRPLPLAGVAMAGAGLLAVAIADTADTDDAGGGLHVLGIAAAAAGAGIGRALRLPLVLRPALVVPGAAVTVGAMELADRSTVLWPTVIVASVLAVLVADADESLAASAAGPPLLAVSIFGMYVTIPETGQILPVLVVAVPIALVGAPLSLARLGAAGSGAVMVLLAAVVAEGGQARAASIVGGLASTGVLALEPVARRLAPDAPPWPADWRSRPVLALAGLHALVVLVVSRVAGLRDDLEGALVISAVAGALALVALVALVRDVERVPGDG
jgi:hypothetical protein